MSDKKLKVAVIIASTREGRFAPTVANWFVSLIRARTDYEVDVIDLDDVRLPDRLTNEPPKAVSDVTPRLAEAEAFVVITPEYNHSFPASLKTLIDWHSEEWQAKPVAFVSYGGQGGGLRAVEHLRHVFTELHALTTRNGLSFHNAWDRFDDDGRPRDREGVEKAAGVMLDQLAWWGLAVREAQARRPYNP